METTLELPLPHLSKGRFASVSALTDQALFDRSGIRIAFTDRTGGVSTGAYASLNLGDHVGDDPACVAQNRARVAEAFGVSPERLVVPRQVHGDRIVLIDKAAAEDIERARAEARAGADALVVDAAGIGALLCYADCVSVIVVSPSGRFAVVHAGWKGVLNGVAAKAVQCLADLDAACGSGPTEGGMNVYIGPHIHAACFETGEDVRARFVERFGALCAPDRNHVDLGCALRSDLARLGIDRVADAGACTVCENERYFSHRAQNGVAGRHGAFAVRSR